LTTKAELPHIAEGLETAEIASRNAAMALWFHIGHYCPGVSGFHCKPNMQRCIPPWFVMGVLVLLAWPALAHRPYDRPAGTFQREDGTTISIVRHYVDGIMFADPVSIQFRLPNGSNVAETPRIIDAVLRTVPSAVEVYQFPSTLVPIASRVDRFDGHKLHSITTERRLISVFVHLAGHWVAYLAVAGLGVLLVRLYLALRGIPKHGWRLALRWTGLGLVCFAGSLFAYDVLLFEPVSPLILGFAGAVVIGALRFFRRKRYATAA
jgi:hypothetical protein